MAAVIAETEHDDPKLVDLQARAERLAANARREAEMSKAETITVLGVVAAGLASLGWAIWAGVKEDRRIEERNRARELERRRRQEELDNWINAQEADGNNVYQLKDGRYLSVSRDAKQVVMIKRTT